jgi:transposase
MVEADNIRVLVARCSDARTASEEIMLDESNWAEVRRLHEEQGWSISAIARHLNLDRKTVRTWLRRGQWMPYRRAVRPDTLLAAHGEFLRRRAPEVQFSARILYQELTRDHGFTGSYDTVKRFVAPLRDLIRHAEPCQTRFETPPGQQSQVDWGEAKVHFRDLPFGVHLFVLTLGYSRRAFYRACPNEQLAQFLDAHELAFEHFGGVTEEILYDRPRTVCTRDADGKRVWNATFKAFADHWGFEPRVCRAYRPQTKGKVESGVKYVKRNFLPGRHFIDIADFQAQLDDWNASIADVRVHGTTHERPVDRFATERSALRPITGHGRFRLQRRLARIVAEDYLVSFETNRYSVPFHLIGQTVECLRVGEELHIFHRDRLVATHPLASGQHQMQIQPEHGPGPMARTGRRSHAGADPARKWIGPHDVEERDPQVYEPLAGEVRS